MKLATLEDGTREGRLVVVSCDVTRFSDARHLARTLQDALDNWARVAPHLDLIARGIETGGQPVERFHEREARAPLPRAYHWLDAQAEAPRPARSEGLLAPRAPIPAAGGTQNRAVEPRLAVILDDVPMGADRSTALAAIRLVMLAGVVSAKDSAKAGSATACSPVTVTPDELGAAWEAGVFTARIAVSLNGEPGCADAATPATIDCATLVVEAARGRALGTGSVLAIALPETPEPWVIRPGDTVRIEMRDAHGRTIFGAIELTLAPATPKA